MHLSLRPRRGLLLAGLLFSILSTNANAGLCGGGKITHIEEGGWNTNDFLIAIDYADEARPSGSWIHKNAYIRFQKDLIDPDRFRGIKAIAYLAFSTGASVRVWAHNASCGNATNLRISKPSNTPNGGGYNPPFLESTAP